MGWLPIALICVYAVIGIVFGWFYANNIVSLLKKARNEAGPYSDNFCIFGAGSGVFLLYLILWLPLYLLNMLSDNHWAMLCDNRIP